MTQMLKVNREAALKALELTPTWTLKQAKLPSENLVKNSAKNLTEQAIELPTKQLAKVYASVEANKQIFAWQSEDGAWLMLTESLGEQEKNLLKNISLALDIQLKTPQDYHDLSSQNAKQNAKEAIVFGQDLVPHLGGLLTTVTHSLAHLLAHGADKAQVWQDLCAARARLQGLNSAQ